MARQIKHSSEFRTIISSGSLALVCFSATWCGPCRMVAPFYDQLVSRYPDVIIAKVYEHECQELIMSEGISAFPTFRFYKNSSKLDEIRGANTKQIEAKIEHWAKKTLTFDSPGHSLSNSSQPPLSAQEAREARLKALNNTLSTNIISTPIPQQNLNKPENNYQNSSVYQQLKEMGFSDIQAYSALNSGANDIETAVNWLTENEITETNIISNDNQQSQQTNQNNDSNLSSNSPDTNVIVSAKSYLCTDCQKLFRDNVSVEMHANKTGHSNFEESIDEIKPMTEEEKKKKLEELQQKAALRRQEREEMEKREEVEREKNRRLGGKGTQQIKEEVEILERRRQAEQLRKDKEFTRLEKQRLLAEIEKDKAERRARGGKLPSVLDIEGYNPNVIQIPTTSSSSNIVSTHPQQQQQSKPPNPTTSPLETIQNCIKTLKNYRVGSDGGKALRILYAYTNNLIEHPEDPKFQSINLDNQAYRTKLAPFVGGPTYLKTIGFVKNEENSRLEVNLNIIDFSLLHTARSLLEQAIGEYEQGN